MKIIKLADITVTGEGITELYNTIQTMLERGNPADERNDWGFNYGDWGFCRGVLPRLNFGPDGMDLELAVRLINMLAKYGHRQLPGYEALKANVKADIARARQDNPLAAPQREAPAAQVAPAAPGDKKVTQVGNDAYGKVILNLPGGVNLGLTRLINTTLREYCQANNVPMVQNRFNQQMEYPLFKFFGKVRDAIDQVAVAPAVLDRVLAVLEAKGYDVTEAKAQAPAAAAQAATKKVTVKGIEVNYGKQQLVILIPYLPEFRSVLQEANLWSRGVWYAGKEGNLGMFRIDLNIVPRARDILNDIRGVDASELTRFLEENQQPVAEEDENLKPLQVKPARLPGKQLGFGSNKDNRPELHDIIKFSFPPYPASREYNRDIFQYEVTGNYADHIDFYRLLKNRGFDAEPYFATVQDMVAKGQITKNRVEGTLEGYDAMEQFHQAVDDMHPHSELKLYPKQKDGAAFLYGRKSFLLGDKTGVGKTAELIVAANMRSQKDNKAVLIITLNSTKLQWKNEVLKILAGDDDARRTEFESLISLDPMRPNRWTICYYDQFSNAAKKPVEREGKMVEIPQREINANALMNYDFGVMVLDECQKVKHATSSRSKLILQLSEKIPFVWGASATVASNKPLDVYNQLHVVKHRLGSLSTGQFKKEFCGMVPEGYGGAYIDGTPEQQQEAAEKLHQWLIGSGVYISRSKKDIRPDMPNITTADLPVEVDTRKYHQELQKRLKTYAQPDLAISELIAARMEIAKAKVPMTVDRVMDLIEEGEKVVVFTCFRDAGSLLVKALTEGCVPLGYTVGTYLGDDPQEVRDQMKVTFTDDPNMKAFVMSMKVGGTGVDFPNVSNYMIVNDFDWTPEQATQSEGRLYRINSEQDVAVEYIVSNNTLDAELYGIIQKKRKISDTVQDLRQQYGQGDDNAIRNQIAALNQQLREIDHKMLQVINAELQPQNRRANRWYQSPIAFGAV